MITAQDMLHGGALVHLVRGLRSVSLESLADLHPSLYFARGASWGGAAILLKQSTKEKRARSRWGFSFTENEEGALRTFRRRHPKSRAFVGLVCRDDGVCCIPERELRDLVDGAHSLAGRRVSVFRNAGGSYHLTGPGRVDHYRAVPQSDWPNALIDG